jgi:hypothetical protein
MAEKNGKDKWGDGMSDEAVQRLIDSMVYHRAGSAKALEIDAWEEVSADCRVSPDGRQFAIRPYLLLRGRR